MQLPKKSQKNTLCHSSRVIVIPSVLLSFFPVYCHSFRRQFLTFFDIFFASEIVILSLDVLGQRTLSRDFCSCLCPGTKGQDFFCPWIMGQQNVTSLGNPTLNLSDSNSHQRNWDKLSVYFSVFEWWHWPKHQFCHITKYQMAKHLVNT